MAGLAYIAGSALINGLAFSGSNYLFSKLDKSGESKRHNVAMENLSRQQEAYTQNRLAQLDFINERLKEKDHANKTYDDVDLALQKYYEITGQRLPTFKKPQPIINYNDNNDTLNPEVVELIMIAVGMTGLFFIIKKYYNKNGS